MKKKLAIVAAVVAVASLAAYGTLAAFTAEETAHNIITAGSVQIELLDKTQTDADVTAVEEMPNFNAVYPDGMAVMPGTNASKVVAVKKLDESAACWVRVRLEPGIQWSADVVDPMSNPGEVVSLDLNLGGDADQWTQGEDGWYYYNSALTDAAPLTASLFTNVHFDGPSMGNDYQNSVFTITVDAEAIQMAHTGDSALEAFGLMAVPEETPAATESPEVTDTETPGDGGDITGEGGTEPTPPAAGE